jgi:hypothetical protein
VSVWGTFDASSALFYFGEMLKVGFTYWRDGDFWLGHLDEFPDYTTQGTSFEDLKEHLLDLHHDLSHRLVPGKLRS